jgi:thioredoxin 2
MVSPVLEQLAGEFAGRLKLVKVNADGAPGLSQRFEVLAIPTLILLEGGKVIDTQVGAAPVAVLRKWVVYRHDSQPSMTASLRTSPHVRGLNGAYS